jgi:hypothetical protein
MITNMTFIDPVLLCNELGADGLLSATTSGTVPISNRTTISIKEAVQIAQNNNFMGLMCSSKLLVSHSTLLLLRSSPKANVF